MPIWFGLREKLPFFEQLRKQRLGLTVVGTSSFPSFASVLNSALVGRETFPVVQIAYEDAEAYAKWSGKRLPTESE